MKLGEKMNNKIQNIENYLKLDTRFNIKDEKEDLNKAINHIVNLLIDSYTLLKHNSYGSSVFLAITSIEETSKTHYSMYMLHNSNTKFNKDPLFNHSKKQQLAISPVFQAESRLTNLLGDEKVKYLISLINENNELMNLRNNAIYWNTTPDKNIFPNECINKNLAQEILLFAIEIFDDNLIGYTSHSLKISKHIDSIFNNIKEDYLRN